MAGDPGDFDAVPVRSARLSSVFQVNGATALGTSNAGCSVAASQASPILRVAASPSGINQYPAANLLLCLREHANDVLRFLTDPRVPFDNKLAECDIRMPKLKQKTSGCLRALSGAESFCTIRS